MITDLGTKAGSRPLHRLRLASLSLAPLVLSACSAQLARPQGPISLAPATEIEVARTFLRCDENSRGAIGAALGSIAIDAAMNAVTALLERAKARRNATWSALGVVSHMNCWTPTSKLADATRPADDAPGSAVSAQRSAADGGSTWGGEGTLVIQRAVLDETGKEKPSPGFELVGVLIATPIGKADAQRLQISYRAMSLSYGRTAAPHRGKGRKRIVVLLGLTPDAILKKAAPASGDEEIAGVIRLDLGTLQDGQTYNADMLGHVRAVSTIAMPANGSTSLNATAIVVESEQEDIALKALSDAFGANKAGLAKALKDALGIK